MLFRRGTMAKTIDYFSVATISFNEKNMQDTQLHEEIMSLLLGTYATRVVCNSVHRQSRAFLKVIFFFFSELDGIRTLSNGLES